MENIRPLLLKFTSGNCDDATLQEIAELRQKDNSMYILFALIEASLDKAGSVKSRSRRYHNLNQVEIQSLLLRMLTFNAGKKDAKLFLAQLVHNPDFLNQIEPSLSVAGTPYSPNLKLPIDITLLDEAEILKTVKERARKVKKRKTTSLLRLIKELLILPNGLPKPIPAFASIIVIFFFTYLQLTPSMADRIFNATFSDKVYLSDNFSPLDKLDSSLYSRSLTLRGDSGTRADITPEIKAFMTLDQALIYYKTQDFVHAARTFEKMDMLIRQAGELDKELVQQFYFYAGMTQLALARNGDDVRHHAAKAASYFEQMQEFTPDAYFYAGFAHYLQGDNERAKEYFKHIDDDSLFQKWAESLN